MKGILAFIFIFGVIVVVHEFGHFYFAKKAGILVREFAIGMGPRFSLIQVRMDALHDSVLSSWWLCSNGRLGEDKTEIKTGTPASLSLNEASVVTRINLTGKQRE